MAAKRQGRAAGFDDDAGLRPDDGCQTIVGGQLLSSNVRDILRPGSAGRWNGTGSKRSGFFRGTCGK